MRRDNVVVRPHRCRGPVSTVLARYDAGGEAVVDRSGPRIRISVRGGSENTLLSMQFACGRAGNAPTTSVCVTHRVAKGSRPPGEAVGPEEERRPPRESPPSEPLGGRRTHAAAASARERRDWNGMNVLSMFQRGALRSPCAEMSSEGHSPKGLLGHCECSTDQCGPESHLTQGQSAIYHSAYTRAAARGRRGQRKAVGVSRSDIEHSVRRPHAASSCLHL